MNSYDYIFALIASFALCLVVTPFVILFAKRAKIIDKPDSDRKIHRKPTPLLGGLAVFLSFNLIVLFYSLITRDLIGDTIIFKNLLGVFLGSFFLALGGFLDDKYNLRPKWQLIWPILAALSVIVCGIGIDWITNPFGDGVLELNKYTIKLFWYHGIAYKFTLLADIFTFVWLLAMMYTTKLLDGLDGLVSGITIIGSIFIFFTALNKGDIIQYDVALLAIILIGVFVGFLVFNFNPASIFLGEGGSTMAGFLLGCISIISGSKVGITLLLLSIPFLDFVWTVVRRFVEKRNLFSADRKHLHHRLLDAGFTVKRAVLFLYSIAVAFGLVAYYFQDKGISFMTAMAAVVVVFMLILAYVYTKKRRKARLLTENN